MRRRHDDPFRELSEFHAQMDRLMDGLFGQPLSAVRPAGENWRPSLDACETADEYLLTVELAGVEPDTVEAILHERDLIIRGARQREPMAEGSTCRIMEINYGSFERRLRLPERVEIDSVEAAFRNGMLRVTLKKAKVGSRVRKVTVQ